MTPSRRRDIVLAICALSLAVVLHRASRSRTVGTVPTKWQCSQREPDRPRFVSDPRERRAAAKLAVASARLSGRHVPDWVRQLAEEPEPPLPEPVLVHVGPRRRPGSSGRC